MNGSQAAGKEEGKGCSWYTDREQWETGYSHPDGWSWAHTPQSPL